MLKKKKKIETIINGAFVLFMLIETISNVFITINDMNVDFSNLIPHIPKISSIVILNTILGNGYFIAVFIVIKLALRHVKKDISKQEVNLQTTLLYFRDILKEVSPATINFINTYEFNYEKTIVSILLNLKLKNKIQIINQKIIIIDENQDNLAQSEMIVIDMIKNCKFNNPNKLLQLNNLIIKEAYDKKYITDRRFDFKRVFKRISSVEKFTKLGPLIILIMIILFSNPITMNLITKNKSIFTIFILLFTFIGIFFTLISFLLSIYSSVYLKNAKQKKYNYIRTKKGEELNLKINGLKKFLQDFGNLEEKEIIHIKQWDEYLIYSVIFDQNNKIVDDIFQIINNQLPSE